ncbi:MAG TPA: response regulator [Pyrinomonadaceae bacterium]|nr:response regulator [Pyrinomonadaceae bacterium]
MAKEITASYDKFNNSVMIVEDDRIVARLLSHTLSQRGFDVQVADNGRSAIESLDQIQPADLVLLDIMLPYADGFEVLSQIRSRKGWENVPIIMLTSKTQEPVVVRAFENGVDDYVTKPFQLGELMVRINRLMK